MKRAGIFCCLVALLGLPGLARAGLVTWEFGGTITSVFDVNNLLSGSVSVGTPFSGSFTFDTITPDSEPVDIVVGDYRNAVTSFAGIVGGNAFDASTPLDLRLQNDASPKPFPHDTYAVFGVAGMLGESLEVYLQLDDTSASMFSTDSVPVMPPSLDGLSFATFGIGRQDLGLWVSGDLTALTPEPTSLALLGLGTLLIVGRRKRRAVPAGNQLRGRQAARVLALAVAFGVGSSANYAPAQEICGCMDIVFVIDVTGSLEPALQKIKDDSRNLIENTAVPASGGDLRLGLITFNDPGLGDDSITVRSSLTTDINALLNQIDALSADAGGGFPEASDEALREMLDETACQSVGDFNVPFRNFCIKHAILITDNLPAGCNDQFDSPLDIDNAHTRAIEALAAGIMISAIYPPTELSAGPCGNPITNLACIIMQDYAGRFCRGCI